MSEIVQGNFLLSRCSRLLLSRRDTGLLRSIRLFRFFLARSGRNRSDDNALKAFTLAVLRASNTRRRYCWTYARRRAAGLPPDGFARSPSSTLTAADKALIAAERVSSWVEEDDLRAAPGVCIAGIVEAAVVAPISFPFTIFASDVLP